MIKENNYKDLKEKQSTKFTVRFLFQNLCEKISDENNNRITGFFKKHLSSPVHKIH